MLFAVASPASRRRALVQALIRAAAASVVVTCFALMLGLALGLTTNPPAASTVEVVVVEEPGRKGCGGTLDPAQRELDRQIALEALEQLGVRHPLVAK